MVGRRYQGVWAIREALSSEYVLPETRQVHCVSSKISDGAVKPRRRVSVCVRSAGKKRLDNRQLPLSAASTRVDIGAMRIGVKQRLHFLAAPEKGNGFASDRNQSPCARISSSPAFPEPYKKNSKSPQFDPITARHCGGNL